MKIDGSISQRHGSADPDPHQNVMDSNTDIKYIFHVRIQLFVMAKSDQDPDPHGSAVAMLPGSGSALR